MIRIVCHHCHASLAATDLEHATFGGWSCVLCPECSCVLVSEFSKPETHGLEEHYPDIPFAKHRPR